MVFLQDSRFHKFPGTDVRALLRGDFLAELPMYLSAWLCLLVPRLGRFDVSKYVERDPKAARILLVDCSGRNIVARGLVG